MSVLVNGEIVLTGFVGDSFWDEGFTDKEVIEALAEIGPTTDVMVRLNSGGGYVSHGKAIYNALSMHKGKVTVSVEGTAASAASVIAMAGEEIIMRRGATMMVHDPLFFTYGNAEEHKKSAEILDKEAVSIAVIYADRSGKTEDECREIMQEETWFTADEAVEEGFATSADTKKAKAVASFDYSIYAHAPRAAVALTKKNSWNLREAMQAASSAVATSPKEPPMAEKNKADDTTNVDADKIRNDAAADATKRIGEILSCDEAKGRDDLAKHIALNTTMSAADAKSMLAAAPKAQADTSTPGGTKTAAENYGQRKAEGDGLAGPENKTNKADISAKWKNAFARANESRGATAS
ncbi:head maturation protease, ClpP-related [Ancylobacter amanitiformis]|uniref:ATP-dependent Clp protease proteolytic subunit n=1 Tax=Ancylobacter amanitiformis TaxID=217069 RepID=A0ABU0LQB0_9HYPH|nr:head maturation protease, ClpP-related [Ancylobacter amanitiformis]MDQ0510887.1 ATP-dependent protease ClpP protease subunit [Ancylobacter amanitiformis]